MANVLRREKQEAVIRCLINGSSVRVTERIADVHRDTIRSMRRLTCRRLQVDEIWGYVGKKQRHLKPSDDPSRTGERLLDRSMRRLTCRRMGYVGKKQRHLKPSDDPSRTGDVWTFVALDPETKLVPAYRLGQRDLSTATAFLTDLSARLVNRAACSVVIRRAHCLKCNATAAFKFSTFFEKALVSLVSLRMFIRMVKF